MIVDYGDRLRRALVAGAGMSVMLTACTGSGAEKMTAAARPDGDMTKRYLLLQVEQSARQWEADYETRRSPAQIAAYQKQGRERLLKAIGGLPEPVPLHAQITGRIQRDGYAVEKVIFESQRGFHVTALLFLPDAARFPPPYPGVVVPVGHTGNGKAWDEFQTMGALLALHGMAGLVYDAVDESERLQYQGERGAYDFDRWGHYLHGTYGHQMIGIGSILLGRNTAMFEIGDTVRAIDYLQSRPDVDPQRIGCTGNSGGGIVTAYAVALDERIKVAAPSCYLNSLPTVLATTGPGDAEQVTWAALTIGPQPTDLLLLRAPTPILVCAATQDQYFDISGARRSLQYARGFYARLGAPEMIDLIEVDARHCYDRVQREGIARWMSRWLLGKDDPIKEPAIQLLSDQEAQCTPGGQVMLLPGARSAYDINEEYERTLAGQRAKAWAEKDRGALLDRVRKIAGVRTLDQLPLPRIATGETVPRAGYRIVKLDLCPEDGIVLPALQFVPDTPSGRVTLYVHEQGKDMDAGVDGPIERLVLGGACVLAVDLRGTGETRQIRQGFWGKIGPDWQDVCTAYCLGRSYVGMRAEDILIAARYAAARPDGGPAVAPDLVAIGNVGIAALHAVALEPAAFNAVKLSHTLVSWASVIERRVTQNQYVNVVHGALLEYDLPNLAATLGKKLTIDDPVEATGRVGENLSPAAAGTNKGGVGSKSKAY